MTTGDGKVVLVVDEFAAEERTIDTTTAYVVTSD